MSKEEPQALLLSPGQPLHLQSTACEARQHMHFTPDIQPIQDAQQAKFLGLANTYSREDSDLCRPLKGAVLHV